METELIELEVTESHAERMRECDDALADADIRRELAALVMQSIDDTYRQVASQDGAPSVQQ